MTLSRVLSSLAVLSASLGLTTTAAAAPRARVAQEDTPTTPEGEQQEGASAGPA